MLRAIIVSCAFALFLCDAATGASLAGASKKVTPLKDLAGVWAHSEADCKKRDTENPTTLKTYGLVGICNDGLDLMHQPVSCVASAGVRRTDKLHVAAVCWTKGTYQSRHSVGITIRSGDAISFNESDFDTGSFSISGDYVRCSRYYRCNCRSTFCREGKPSSSRGD
jgi:hypothetical protein